MNFRQLLRAAAFAGAALALTGVPVFAGQVTDRVRASGTVRVCIWPDYYGISLRDSRSGQLSGIDIDLSAEFARSIGARLQYVDSSFASLVDDLTKDRCDVSMHAVGVTQQRAKALRFSRPYMSSSIYGVTTRTNRVVRKWDDIDQPGVRVAVQAGTFMEPVMAATLKNATLVLVRPPLTREQELESGRVDVFMTDYPYSRRLLDNAEWARLIDPGQPFHPVPYAYAVKPGDDEWLKLVDGFVKQIQEDGRLLIAARKAKLDSIIMK
jgi:cyclohexadienyl dehydratase